MMDCRECDALLDRWEEGAAIAPEELEALVAHIDACAACAARYGLIAALLRRESSGGAAGPDRLMRGAPVSPSARALADGVMARIAAASRPPLRRDHPKSRGFAIPALAAVAAALVLGLSLWLFKPSDSGMITVRFVLEAPDARTVALAGDFSDWSSDGLMMKRRGAGGPWEIKIKLERGSLHAYNFVIDGERWIPDPAVPERVDDGFGGSSSLLKL